MTVEIEVKVSNTMTLCDFDKLLNALDINDAYGVGGNENCIQYCSDGTIWVYEIDEKDMPRILRILHEAGAWPDYFEGAFDRDPPTREECEEMLERNRNDYEGLWQWMCEYMEWKE